MLSTLPLELLIDILLPFNYKDLSRLSRVNRYLRQVSKSDLLWRPKANLECLPIDNLDPITGLDEYFRRKYLHRVGINISDVFAEASDIHDFRAAFYAGVSINDEDFIKYLLCKSGLIDELLLAAVSNGNIHWIQYSIRHGANLSLVKGRHLDRIKSLTLFINTVKFLSDPMSRDCNLNDSYDDELMDSLCIENISYKDERLTDYMKVSLNAKCSEVKNWAADLLVTSPCKCVLIIRLFRHLYNTNDLMRLFKINNDRMKSIHELSICKRPWLDFNYFLEHEFVLDLYGLCPTHDEKELMGKIDS